MLFNSIEYLIFFPLVVAGYFLLPHGVRWAWLLAASCLFYMTFIPVYILILLATIIVDYVAAIYIEKGKAKKALLIVSICATCLILFVFKYYNFFSVNLNALAAFLHWNYSVEALSLVLPIGLSFHTFQSLSYVIEVYKGRQKAEKNFGIYSLYVMFFPQLVAGPIERPQNLLHQFYERHVFEHERVVKGLMLILWGMFKKVVVADRLAIFVTEVYKDPTAHTGPSLIMATIYFAIQIYCDFSGYSDIAIGSAQVLGFKLMTNFNRPYFARTIAEFWKRWHISLSTWFKDYLYVPLGGNRVNALRWSFNIVLVFLVSGLWHGANWTYIVWGLLHGLYMVCGRFTAPLRDSAVKMIGLSRVPFLHRLIQTGITFVLVCFAWIFFRANTMEDALYISGHLFSGVGEYVRGLFTSMGVQGAGKLGPFQLGQLKKEFMLLLFGLVFLFIIEVIQRKLYIREWVRTQNVIVRWSLYYAFIFMIITFGVFGHVQFIYFQF